MSNLAPFHDVLRTQPEELLRVQQSLLADLERVQLPEWEPGQTVAVIAMGASHNAGHALTAITASAGLRAVNLIASEVLAGPAGYQPADHYIIVSESGRSPEPIEAARRLARGHRIGISNFPNAQINEVVDVSLGLGGVLDSRVYTVGYTGTLLAFALLLDKWGVVSADQEISRVPAILRETYDTYAARAQSVGDLIGASSFVDVIGAGTSYSTAAEFALMIREGLRIPAAAHETFEYLHGPMVSVGQGTVVVVFGDGRETTVPDPLLAAGIPVVLVTCAASSTVPSSGNPLLTVIELDPSLGGFVRPIVETAFAQLVLACASEHKPFSVDEPVFEDLGTKLPQLNTAAR